jgi:hypothetical protein
MVAAKNVETIAGQRAEQIEKSRGADLSGLLSPGIVWCTERKKKCVWGEKRKKKEKMWVGVGVWVGGWMWVYARAGGAGHSGWGWWGGGSGVFRSVRAYANECKCGVAGAVRYMLCDWWHVCV